MFNKLDYYSLKDNQYICNKCHHQLTANFENHALSCDGTGPKRKIKPIYTEELKEKYLIENNKWICKKCELEIKSAREKHINSCDGRGKRRCFDLSKINIQIKEGQLCSFGCGKPATHYFKSSMNFGCSSNANSCEANRQKNSQAKKGINPWEGKEHPRGMVGKTPHNKGKKLEELYSPQDVERLRMIHKKGLEKGRQSFSVRSPQQEEQRREKLRQHALNNNYGGYQKGSGRGKSGWYQGYWCDSSYELAFVIYHLEHNIDFKRNTQSYEYIYQGKTHQYYPDFLVADKLIEIKGYIDEQVQEKLKQCPVAIEVWMKEDMKHIFDYVHTKYGKKFISLYEKT